jgi:hypothetical protein
MIVSSAPLFNNDFPLNTSNAYPSRKSHDAVANAIVGAAPGAAVNVVNNRLVHRTNDQADVFGSRSVETVTELNRNTTSQDATNIKSEVVIQNSGGLVFARDLSGNGGPAFTRS